RLRQQPLRPDLTRPPLQAVDQATDLVQPRAQVFDPTQLRRDLRERAGGVLIQAADAPLARLDLAADRARPRFRLLAKAAQLGFRRAPVVEHFTEPFDEGKVERLWHLGRAILSDAPRPRFSVSAPAGRSRDCARRPASARGRPSGRTPP